MSRQHPNLTRFRAGSRLYIDSPIYREPHRFVCVAVPRVQFGDGHELQGRAAARVRLVRLL